MPTDKERIDWMEKNRPCCYEWDNGIYQTVGIGQHSDDGTCGRGLTVRESIDAAMKEAIK